MDILHPEISARLELFLPCVLICFTAIFLANAVDMIDAIITARHIGTPMQSAKLRHALEKWGKYGLVFCLPALFDAMCMLGAWYSVTFLCIIYTLSVVLIEGWSVKEHAKCRKDRVAKTPKVLQELEDYLGKDDTREMIKDFLRRKLG